MADLSNYLSLGGSGLKVVGIGRAGFSTASTGTKAVHKPTNANRKFLVFFETTDNGVNDGEVRVTGNIVNTTIPINELFNRKVPVLVECEFDDQFTISVTQASTNAGNAYYTIYEMEKDA